MLITQDRTMEIKYAYRSPGNCLANHWPCRRRSTHWTVVLFRRRQQRNGRWHMVWKTSCRSFAANLWAHWAFNCLVRDLHIPRTVERLLVVSACDEIESKLKRELSRTMVGCFPLGPYFRVGGFKTLASIGRGLDSSTCIPNCRTYSDCP